MNDDFEKDIPDFVKEHQPAPAAASFENTHIDVLGNIQDLRKMRPSAVGLNTDYYTPEKVGEQKFCIVLGIERSIYHDEKTGEAIPLDCVVFVEQKEDLSLVRMRNGACKFVATVQAAIASHTIVSGVTPILIEYLGKTKTKNGNFTDSFSVKLLG
jgi:hypothetical protein